MEVDAEILSKIVEENDYLVVLLYRRLCTPSKKALLELENIEEEADQLGIIFVKMFDESLADECNLPKLVFYRHQIPIFYEGALTNGHEVLEWLVSNKSTGDDDDEWLVSNKFKGGDEERIRNETAEALEDIIGSIDHLAVLFYNDEDEYSMAVLKKLEKIDDVCNKSGIDFVPIDQPGVAKEYGIDDVPALVYFENGIPSLYEGDLNKEEEVLDWILHQKSSDEIEDLTDEMRDKLIFF